MNWFILIVAGLFEVVWAVGLKYSDGFSQFWPSVITLIAMGISFALLGIAMKSLPIGTAYAIWVAIGIVGTAILGMMVFNESANGLRLLGLALIIIGVISLKIGSST